MWLDSTGWLPRVPADRTLKTRQDTVSHTCECISGSSRSMDDAGEGGLIRGERGGRDVGKIYSSSKRVWLLIRMLVTSFYICYLPVTWCVCVRACMCVCVCVSAFPTRVWNSLAGGSVVSICTAEFCAAATKVHSKGWFALRILLTLSIVFDIPYFSIDNARVIYTKKV